MFSRVCACLRLCVAAVVSFGCACNSIQDTCHLEVVSQGIHKADQGEDLHRPRAPDLPSGMALQPCVFSATVSRLRPPLVHAANAHAHQLGDYECHDRLAEHHGHVAICEELLTCRTLLDSLPPSSASTKLAKQHGKRIAQDHTTVKHRLRQFRSALAPIPPVSGSTLFEASIMVGCTARVKTKKA